MKPGSESLNQNLNTSLDWLLIVCGSWWSFVDFLWETLKCLEPQFLQSRSHRMTQLKLDFLRKSIRTTAARLSREEVKRWRSRVQTPPEDLQSPDDNAYETSNTAGKLRYRRRVTQRKVSKDASKQTTMSNTLLGRVWMISSSHSDLTRYTIYIKTLAKRCFAECLSTKVNQPLNNSLLSARANPRSQQRGDLNPQPVTQQC